jgi:hypothetical protein
MGMGVYTPKPTTLVIVFDMVLMRGPLMLDSAGGHMDADSNWSTPNLAMLGFFASHSNKEFNLVSSSLT